MIPQTAGGIVSELAGRDGILAELVRNEDWYALHNPAFDAKDLVAALSEKQDGLNVRQRGSLKKVIGLINRGANALDRAGDAGDEARVRRAYETFSQGMLLLRNIYPDTK